MYTYMRIFRILSKQRFFRSLRLFCDISAILVGETFSFISTLSIPTFSTDAIVMIFFGHPPFEHDVIDILKAIM